jgi:hypothetical protein
MDVSDVNGLDMNQTCSGDPVLSKVLNKLDATNVECANNNESTILLTVENISAIWQLAISLIGTVAISRLG